MTLHHEISYRSVPQALHDAAHLLSMAQYLTVQQFACDCKTVCVCVHKLCPYCFRIYLYFTLTYEVH
jgi:hypothetical protein